MMVFDDVEALIQLFTQEDQARDAGLEEPRDLVVWRDLPYGPHGTENLLDIYYPKQTTDKLPCIINVHGGAYFYGSKEIYRFYSMALAQLGFVVVNFNYRLAPKNTYPTPLEDLNQVCQWLLNHLEDYPIDATNFFMVGDSAGAQIASQYACVLTNAVYAKLFNFEPANITLRALGLNCGVYLMGLDQPINYHFPAYFNPETIEKVQAQFPVEHYITEEFPPTYVMAASDDYLKETSQPFASILKQKGVTLLYKEYEPSAGESLGHVFHLDQKHPVAHHFNQEQVAYFRQYIR